MYFDEFDAGRRMNVMYYIWNSDAAIMKFYGISCISVKFGCVDDEILWNCIHDISIVHYIVSIAETEQIS